MTISFRDANGQMCTKSAWRFALDNYEVPRVKTALAMNRSVTFFNLKNAQILLSSAEAKASNFSKINSGVGNSRKTYHKKSNCYGRVADFYLADYSWPQKWRTSLH